MGIVNAQVGAAAGACGWMPFAAPALWALASDDVTLLQLLQLLLPLLVPTLFGIALAWSWARLQLNRQKNGSGSTASLATCPWGVWRCGRRKGQDVGMTKKLAAVLWDMDGTLVDTEPYWMDEEKRIVEEFGHGSWTQEDALMLVGNPLLVSARIISERGGVDLAPEVIVDRLLDAVIARVRTHIPFRPGARELLLQLREAGVPCALVTMSYRNFADAIAAGVPEGSFDAVVAGDEVQNGKPHPEPYLKAAAELGVDPRDCVALEDSIPGLGSAEAAGTAAIGIPHMVPIPEQPGRTLLTTLEGVSPEILQQVLEASHNSPA
ncbi:HAD family phosphatase [Saxibacter everestensis]|uniref:HAD family phosphatase n=1 Tax=Saxibacter everestensis TaxID=2909229 RepID=A0ABY8QX88_9MICO|nr:HAD family phosphatase [Brevibacteriaceae bacterium ZFBP1038]